MNRTRREGGARRITTLGMHMVIHDLYLGVLLLMPIVIMRFILV